VVSTVPVACALLAAAAADDIAAVGPYIAPVERLPDGGVQPANLRERIRLGGPTVGLPAVELPITFGI
jgi:hypothetical protein